jgi:hypothetical protein
MTILNDLSFLQYLKQECGYKDPRPLPGGRFAAILPLMYTNAIVVGRMGDDIGYDNRWCYRSYESAKAALDAWNGEGEPEGWHRHPPTGRRRNAKGEEYINP